MSHRPARLFGSVVLKYTCLLGLVALFTLACANAQHDLLHSSPECMGLNNGGMDFMLEGKSDSALLLINQAIACDSSYTVAWHNRFAIQFELGAFEECLVTLRHLKALVPSNEAMFLAYEAQCHFRLEHAAAFAHIRDQAIARAEAAVANSTDPDLHVNVIMIRAMLLGKEDAIIHLRALRERGDVSLDFDFYERLIRDMGPVGTVPGVNFSIGP